MGVVRTVAWLAALVYSTIPAFWLVIHPFAGYWRTRHRKPLLVLGPMWLMMWVLAGYITAPWRNVLLYDHSVAWIAGLALLATAVFIYRRAHHDFTADQVLGRSELQPAQHEQRLATTGIRARMRHPLYLAHLCALLGLTVGAGSRALFVLTAFAVVTGFFMIRMEERELEQRFGEEYREYKRRVPAILPRL